MSNIIDPPCVQVAAKGGKPRFGKHPRLMLSGATVDESTYWRAKAWRGKSLSLGLLLDQLFAFAHTKGFKPNRARR